MTKQTPNPNPFVADDGTFDAKAFWAYLDSVLKMLVSLRPFLTRFNANPDARANPRAFGVALGNEIADVYERVQTLRDSADNASTLPQNLAEHTGEIYTKSLLAALDGRRNSTDKVLAGAVKAYKAAHAQK